MKSLAVSFLVVCCVLTLSRASSPPHFVKQPPNGELLFSVEDGIKNSILLECEADGDPRPKYKWMKNGQDFHWVDYSDRMFSVGKGASLLLHATSEEDSGYYQCFAQNEVGQAMSDVVHVRASYLHDFVSGRPLTLIVNEGEPIKLPCQPPNSYPKPLLYWKIQENLGGKLRSIDATRMTVDPEGSLWLTNITREDASNEDTYVCIAYVTLPNLQFKIGNKVVLIVNQSITNREYEEAPKKEYVSPKVVSAQMNEEIQLWYIYGGTPQPKISWSHHGSPLSVSRRHAIDNFRYGSTLTVRDTKPQDEGSYQCTASNGVGMDETTSFHLNVVSRPYFTVAPEVTFEVEGGSAELYCEANGIPSPTIQWFKNGERLELGHNNNRETEVNKIKITHLDVNDTGNYACNASNVFGYVFKDVYLNVLHMEPKIIAPARNILAEPVGTINLICNATGGPKPEVTWFKNDKELQGERFALHKCGTLTISNITVADEGQYTCQAKNKYGEASISVTLQVKPIPNTPELIRVNCKPMTAELEWKHPGTQNSSTTSYTIQYNTSFAPNTWVDQAVNIPPYASRFEVRMSPWVNYTFRVVAINDKGESSPSLPGPTHPCQTPPEQPHTNPRNVEGRGTAPNNMVISWTPMPEIEHNAPDLIYEVMYKPDIDDARWTIIRIYDWTVDHYVVKNTDVYKRYRIGVSAFNAYGRSLSRVTEVIAYSGEDVPLEAPQNFRLVNIVTGDSATFSWDEVDPNSVQGNFKGYKVETWSDGERPEDARVTVLENHLTEALIRGLIPYAINMARIRVFNGAYDGPPSTTISFHTPEGVPGAVGSFEATPISSSTLFVTWTAPKHPNGMIVKYEVRYQKAAIARIEPSQQKNVVPSERSCIVDDLEADTQYRLTIQAFTYEGPGQIAMIERKTLAD